MLPAGTHEGLTAWQTPFDKGDSDKRFILEGESASGPASWWATASDSTVYAIDGTTTPRAEFVRVMARRPSRSGIEVSRAVADEDGRLTFIEIDLGP